MANWTWMGDIGPGQWYDGTTNTWGGTDQSVDPNLTQEKTYSSSKFGIDSKNTVALLDAAAKQLGIEVSDWTPYAEGIIRRDSINGGQGWEPGANSAYIANHILRELSFDPKYADKFNALPPDRLQAIRNAGGSTATTQGAIAPTSSVYQNLEQEGLARDAGINEQANLSTFESGLKEMMQGPGSILASFLAPGASQLLAGATGMTPTLANIVTGLAKAVATGQNPLTSLATSVLPGMIGGAGDSLAGAGTQLPGGQEGFDLLAGMDLANTTTAGTGGLDQILAEGFNAGAQGIQNSGNNLLAQADTGTVTDVTAGTTGVFDGVGDVLSGNPVGFDDYGAPIGANNSSATYVAPNINDPSQFTPTDGGANTSLYDTMDIANNTSYGANDLASTVGGTTTATGGGLNGTTAGVVGAGAVAAGGGLTGNSGGDPDLPGVGEDSYNTLPGTNVYNPIVTPTGGGKLTLQDLINDPSLENITKLLTGEGGGYKLPLDKLVGGLLEGFGGMQKTDALTDAVNKATAASDPFASQRGFYQGELKNMFTDPNYFNNNALLKGANANAVNDTSRALAARGYNMSGNEGMDIAQRLQNNNMQYGQNLMNQTGGFAGAGFGPGLSGQVSLSGNTAVANQGMQNNGTLGNIIGNLFKGAQSNTPNTTTGTMSGNDGLSKFLFG